MTGCRNIYLSLYLSREGEISNEHFFIIVSIVKTILSLSLTLAVPSMVSHLEFSLQLLADALCADVVEMLLGEGKANVSACDVQGASPLHQAVLNGHKAIGLALLSKYAMPFYFKFMFVSLSLSLSHEELLLSLFVFISLLSSSKYGDIYYCIC